MVYFVPLSAGFRLSRTEEAARGLFQPGSWLVQGTLGLAYPGSYESHVLLAKWYD